MLSSMRRLPHEGLFQCLIFLQREESIKIVNKHQAVFQLNHTLNLLHVWKNAFRGDDIFRRPLDHSDHDVHCQCNGSARGACNDEPILHADFAFDAPKSPADIEQRHDLPMKVNDAENRLWRLRERRIFHGMNDGHSLRQAHGIRPFVQTKNQKLNAPFHVEIAACVDESLNSAGARPMPSKITELENGLKLLDSAASNAIPLR